MDVSESEILDRLQRIELTLATLARPKARSREPLRLTEKLISTFIRWSEQTKRNSRKWVRDQQRYLRWWRDELGSRDLRSLVLEEHILPALDRSPGAVHLRIAVLKRLYSYLRKERHLVKSGEDPTLHTLSVPQSKPAQWKKPKHFTRRTFQLVRLHLEQPWRDAVDVLAGTGWHVSELDRFVHGGSIGGKHGRAAGVLTCPLTKSGEVLRTAVSEPVLKAGRQLLKRREFSEKWFRQAMRRACRLAGIEPIAPGQFRHAVATWAINHGADPASVASFLNHKSPRTTRRFYATHAVPKKVPTLA